MYAYLCLIILLHVELKFENIILDVLKTLLRCLLASFVIYVFFTSLKRFRKFT